MQEKDKNAHINKWKQKKIEGKKEHTITNIPSQTHSHAAHEHTARSKIKYICYSFNNHELCVCEFKEERELKQEKNTDGKKKNNSFVLFFFAVFYVKCKQTKRNFFLCFIFSNLIFEHMCLIMPRLCSCVWVSLSLSCYILYNSNLMWYTKKINITLNMLLYCFYFVLF